VFPTSSAYVNAEFMLKGNQATLQRANHRRGYSRRMPVDASLGYTIHPTSRAFILAASHAMARKSLELMGASVAGSGCEDLMPIRETVSYRPRYGSRFYATHRSDR
jgi:hypothetical protein